ncbi:hypothetical protein GGR53DRAFT_468296 [Hypoxylon sp. FL1150]|nr:hypothetical protein GGR53DRAFT_468296 [Hypoxylon sp. FL1150]
MAKSPRPTSPHPTSGRSHATASNSPVRGETGGDMHSTSPKTNKNGQNHRVGQRDQKYRYFTPRTNLRSASKANGQSNQNHAHGGQRAPSTTSLRDQVMQRIQSPGLPPIQQISLAKTTPGMDTQLVASHNAQVASMQATITMLRDDLSRRTSELIEAKTAVAYKESEISQLTNVIYAMQEEHTDLANRAEEAHYETDQVKNDLSLEIDILRDAIRTGIVSIADLYGSNALQAFTRTAEESRDRVTNGRTTPEPAPIPSRKPSSERSPAAPASISSGSTKQLHTLAIDASSQKQPHPVYSGPPSEASDKMKVAKAIGEPLEETIPVEVAPQVHEEQEVESTQDTHDTQEDQPSKESETAQESQHSKEGQASEKTTQMHESQSIKDSTHQEHLDDNEGPSIDVKSVTSNAPVITPGTPDVSMKNGGIHDSSASPTTSPAHPANDSPKAPAETPAARPLTNQPRSWANVARSPPNEIPAAPREKIDDKAGTSPQVRGSFNNKNAPKTLKAVNSDEFGKSRWRDRAITERTGTQQDAVSSKASERSTSTSWKSKRSNTPAKADARAPSPNRSTKDTTGQSEGQPEEQEDGWKSVKSKYKPKKKFKKPKGANQSHGHPTNQPTNGANGKPTPEDSSNALASANTLPKENHTMPQTQQKWKKFNGTVIGSNSIFSQSANKQREDPFSPTAQEHSGLRDVSNSGTRGQRSSSGGQFKTQPKKSGGSPHESKFDWAEDVEREFSQKNQDDSVHASY